MAFYYVYDVCFNSTFSLIHLKIFRPKVAKKFTNLSYSSFVNFHPSVTKLVSLQMYFYSHRAQFKKKFFFKSECLMKRIISITPLTFPRGVKLKPSRPNPATFFVFQMDFLRSERFSRKSAEIIITITLGKLRRKELLTNYQIFLLFFVSLKLADC